MPVFAAAVVSVCEKATRLISIDVNRKIILLMSLDFYFNK
jgi:hypothetical protein